MFCFFVLRHTDVSVSEVGLERVWVAALPERVWVAAYVWVTRVWIGVARYAFPRQQQKAGP
jgi:hypothetical protein